MLCLLCVQIAHFTSYFSEHVSIFGFLRVKEEDLDKGLADLTAGLKVGCRARQGMLHHGRTKTRTSQMSAPALLPGQAFV